MVWRVAGFQSYPFYQPDTRKHAVGGILSFPYVTDRPRQRSEGVDSQRGHSKRRWSLERFLFNLTQ